MIIGATLTSMCDWWIPLYVCMLTFTQLSSITERFKLCWRTFYDVPKITLYHRQPQTHWSCHWSGHLCLLVISLLFRTFCVLLSLIIQVILTCGKKRQRSKPQKSMWSTVKTPKRAGQSFDLRRSHDYRVNGSDTPLLHSGFDISCGVLHRVGLFRWLTLLLVILTWTHTNIKLYSVLLCYVHLEYPQSVIHALEYSGVTLSTAAFSNSVGSWKAAATLTCTFK